MSRIRRLSGSCWALIFTGAGKSSSVRRRGGCWRRRRGNWCDRVVHLSTSAIVAQAKSKHERSHHLRSSHAQNRCLYFTLLVLAACVTTPEIPPQAPHHGSREKRLRPLSEPQREARAARAGPGQRGSVQVLRDEQARRA